MARKDLGGGLDFFAKLNFSSTNEDGATEIAALAGAQRILALTGTGTRVLDLLLTDATEVIALDANPAQNALLALKMAAIVTLDYDACLAFLGIAPAADRAATYAMLRHRLDPAAQRYWDAQPALVTKGVWHAGQWERLLRWNARFLALFRGAAVRGVMAAATPEVQAAIWTRHFTSGRWQRRIESFARDIVWRFVMREPAAAYLPSAARAGARIEADFAAAARRFRFADSDVATLALTGRHTTTSALPVHLRRTHYAHVQSALPRLRSVVGTLADLPTIDIPLCDGFSLSDFGSYCGPEDYAACWQGIISKAAPGAVFCEREFMNSMAPPSDRVIINPERSAQLSDSDQSIIYRIRAGHIIGAIP